MLLRAYIPFLTLSVCITLAACAPAATPLPSNDKLAQVMQRGTLIVATDAAYPPQSFVIEGAPRPTDTRCASDQYAASQIEGFDVGVAVEIAKRLGVEACFVTPSWDLITAGGWGDRWDIHIGQMTMTNERAAKFYFAQPYSSGASAFYVPAEASYTNILDLEGKRIGVCGGCFTELLLQGQLSLPGQNTASPLQNPQIVAYVYEEDAMAAMVTGELDAVLAGADAAELIIQKGLKAKQLGPAVIYSFVAPAFDREAPWEMKSFVDKVSDLIQTMHADGTLAQQTRGYYTSDSYALVAARFNYRDFKQFP